MRRRVNRNRIIASYVEWTRIIFISIRQSLRTINDRWINFSARVEYVVELGE